MCGIAGFLTRGNFTGEDDLANRAERMAAGLVHRGPDDAGVWTDAAAGVALAHRRLSILDLSSAGHQPMISSSGRHVLIFNGEIYNHLELRRELEGASLAPGWIGHSDTETLLACLEAWGIEGALKKTIGMFALAVWDRVDRTLTLARDRLGEKPLYYGWQGRVFLFGSELRALRSHPEFQAEINRDALALLVRYNYIPSPYSIFRGISKLSPGTVLTVSVDNRNQRVDHYWDAKKIIEQAQSDPFPGSPAEAAAELEVLLKDAVAKQMITDVPIGAFLSGGVDSSAIVALMQQQSDRPVRTFTIGFQDNDFNEAVYAKSIARHLGTDHTELYVTSRHAQEVIPRLPGIYSEPFADSSQIPTFLVSELARQHVTVSVSGDGGDELFGGYNRYVFGWSLWKKLSCVPLSARKHLANIISTPSPDTINRYLGYLKKYLPSHFAHVNIGDKLRKLSMIMTAKYPSELYHLLVSQWRENKELVMNRGEPIEMFADINQQPRTDHCIHQMMALDLLTYLPDDILCKVDRAAMAVSLETRVPFLDHRVVEFAWRLPLKMKIRDGQGKWILRQLLYKHVPRELIERPKMGFGVPIDSWLRGPLRDWAEDLLDESRLIREDYFQPNPIRQKWAEHLAGKQNWSSHLWSILVFQMWHKDFKN